MKIEWASSFRPDGSRRRPPPSSMHGWLAKMRGTLLGNEELRSKLSTLFRECERCKQPAKRKPKGAEPKAVEASSVSSLTERRQHIPRPAVADIGRTLCLALLNPDIHPLQLEGPAQAQGVHRWRHEQVMPVDPVNRDPSTALDRAIRDPSMLLEGPIVGNSDAVALCCRRN
ncbi:hypothetical protein D9615_000566 [Tricholomella constricta]|uniref:Uncharacterized protein n=1 Tax=Tricholomella constricta TaxID=117010 RepID=A0A8H5HRD9_9AGAR|nr:hypothetical protein D9615_000566 [Tricholomella constricta]